MIGQSDPQLLSQAFQHSWRSYESYAWGLDELMPLTKSGRNSFGGIGATLIDALDTLHMLGMHAEFERSAPGCEETLGSLAGAGAASQTLSSYR